MGQGSQPPPAATDAHAEPRLSICIATYGRATYIGQTLDSILEQVCDGVEVVVLYGASPDQTEDVVGAYRTRYACLRYFREQTNGGVDQDFDKAVMRARGTYCWLMSDDDVLGEGAVAAVLDRLRDDPTLVVVNAEVRNKDLTTVIKPNHLGMEADITFGPDELDRLFARAGSYLSFIGGVVIDRAAWLARERSRYYGSLFIHIGVLFQSPTLGPAKILARPLIRIRYGNAQWTGRSFAIWTQNWPHLIWAFPHFSDSTKREIVPREPARRIRTLLWYRALGAYGWTEYKVARAAIPLHPLARVIAVVPAVWVNALLAVYLVVVRHRDAPFMLYDLAVARVASRVARFCLTRFLSRGRGR